MAKNNNNNNNNNNKDGNMTVEEAGRKGGEATSRNHDREFYEEIGSKGGKANAENNNNNVTFSLKGLSSFSLSF